MEIWNFLDLKEIYKDIKNIYCLFNILEPDLMNLAWLTRLNSVNVVQPLIQLEPAQWGRKPPDALSLRLSDTSLSYLLGIPSLHYAVNDTNFLDLI